MDIYKIAAAGRASAHAGGTHDEPPGKSRARKVLEGVNTYAVPTACGIAGSGIGSALAASAAGAMAGGFVGSGIGLLAAALPNRAYGSGATDATEEKTKKESGG